MDFKRNTGFVREGVKCMMGWGRFVKVDWILNSFAL